MEEPEVEVRDGVELSTEGPPDSNRPVCAADGPVDRPLALGFTHRQQQIDTTAPTRTNDRNALTTITKGR